MQGVERACPAVTDFVLPYMLAYAQSRTRRIDIVVKDMPSDLVNQYRTLIGKLTYVTKYADESISYDADDRVAKYPVMYLSEAADADVLGLQLSALPRLTVDHVSYTRVEATYSEQP